MYSALTEVAEKSSQKNSEMLRFPLTDMKRQQLDLENLYALFDDALNQWSVGISLHERVFVGIENIIVQNSTSAKKT